MARSERRRRRCGDALAQRIERISTGGNWRGRKRERIEGFRAAEMRLCED